MSKIKLFASGQSLITLHMVQKIARVHISWVSPITGSVVFHFPYVRKLWRWALSSQQEQCEWDCSVCIREALGPCENRLSEPGSSHGAACQCNDWINTNQAPWRSLCVHTSLTAFHTINTNTAGFKMQVRGVIATWILVIMGRECCACSFSWKLK